ncbi:hypothetical protein GCM10018790_38960 [Kitasatospora xanthocidica]|nr:hypothetical protein GCM10018790_38960 [Kitasatospora xanthocidica]
MRSSAYTATRTWAGLLRTWAAAGPGAEGSELPDRWAGAVRLVVTDSPRQVRVVSVVVIEHSISPVELLW